MLFRTGRGLERYCLPMAVASISNYRSANSEGIMGSMSEIVLLNGDRFVADGKAAELYLAMLKEHCALLFEGKVVP